MGKQPHQGFRLTTISAALISSFTASSVAAQSSEALQGGIEKIEITATRRSGTVQEAPLNITALTADVLAEQNIGDLEDVARWVPGLTVTDQGGRQDSPIIVRGLNTNSSGPGSDGGTVATYVGEIPLFINLRLNDIERVEVLIGPQGTLYGAGTLGGAIRYIPKKADLEFFSGEVYGDIFSLSESDSMGGEGGFIANIPLITDTLALRTSINYFNNPGFIDYAYTVKTPGVSLADPDWSNSSEINDNLQNIKDANGEKTMTAKVSLRWLPTDLIDANLSYFYQDKEVEGRSISHYGSLAAENGLGTLVGPYESTYRVEEPNDITDELLSLEVNADLEFADLVSATGWSKYNQLGQRDQSDLLIWLSFSYEEFPSFTAFTREEAEVKNFTQELRLVSKDDSDLSWIVGAFYNKQEEVAESREFTPHYDEFIIGDGEGLLRPDALEYIEAAETEITEKAIFGELAYQLTDKLTLTFGARFYEYNVTSKSAFDLPLANTVFDGVPADVINLEYETLAADDNGSLFKFNASYQMDADVLLYGTVSEGFRIGGANGVPLCPADLNPQEQNLCALPNEVFYTPDTTINYELGFKSTWFKNKLHFNAAAFLVDWQDAQVNGATSYGSLPITSNAAGAQSQGIEISSRAIMSDNLTAYATFSYTQAELAADAPFLFATHLDENDEPIIPVPGFYDGKDGDRLPGSPETQFSFGLKYTQEIFGDKLLDVIYGLTAQSDVVTTVGMRNNGEILPGYGLSNLSASISGNLWAVTLYVDNLFDKYTFTSSRVDKSYIGIAEYDFEKSNAYDLIRNYGHFVNMPRKVGVKFTYKFE
ncbi:TonB-dependent receptor [Alteromonadaceae bacterium BrNp21-10]|nr:TonB-dependent receptor [Alteromonadaceae bacterium BrNp21-10]